MTVAFQTAVTGYGQGRGELGRAIESEHRIHDTELALLRTERAELIGSPTPQHQWPNQSKGVDDSKTSHPVVLSSANPAKN